MFGDQLISHIRTYVPIVVGTALTYVSRKTGFVVDEDAAASVTMLIAGIVTAAYYTLVRMIERVNPKLGWLLGVAKPPTYAKTVTPQPPPPPPGA